MRVFKGQTFHTSHYAILKVVSQLMLSEQRRFLFMCFVPPDDYKHYDEYK